MCYYKLCYFMSYLKKFFFQYSYSIYESCQVKVFLEFMKIAVTKACRFSSIVRKISQLNYHYNHLLQTNCDISIDDIHMDVVNYYNHAGYLVFIQLAKH